MAHQDESVRADPITRVIAQRVAELRKQAGLSQTELGARMERLRPQWSRSTVVKLESMRRETLPVGDLLALARVLKVPHVWLLVDPASGESVPIPDAPDADAWSALLWLIGKVPLGEDTESWTAAARPIAAVYLVAQILDDHRSFRKMRDVTQVLRYEDEAEAGRAEEAELAAERRMLGRLVGPLKWLAEDGYPLPPLPDDLSARAAELGVELPRAGGS